jgi:hypothetical protein
MGVVIFSPGKVQELYNVVALKNSELSQADAGTQFQFETLSHPNRGRHEQRYLVKHVSYSGIPISTTEVTVTAGLGGQMVSAVHPQFRWPNDEGRHSLGDLLEAIIASDSQDVATLKSL